MVYTLLFSSLELWQRGVSTTSAQEESSTLGEVRMGQPTGKGVVGKLELPGNLTEQ